MLTLPVQPLKFHVDPLTCTKCGGKLKIIAYLHDQASISKILDHLGLSPPETKLPPAVHEVVRVAVDEESREIGVPWRPPGRHQAPLTVSPEAA